MDTIIKSHAVVTDTTKTKTGEFWKQMEASRYGIVPMLLVVIACIGGIAAAYAVQNNDAALLTVAMSTMMVEVLVVAVAPMRIVFWSAAIALLVDLVIFIF